MRPLQALAAVFALACGAASAHDTWFEPLQRTPAGHVVLALGTGTQFPIYEYRIGIEQLARGGCEGEAVTAAPLKHVDDQATTLIVRSAEPMPADAALTCWTQLVPFDITIAPPIVEIYLNEIQASDEVRAIWAERQTRGVTWTERYVKYARIELGRTPGVDRTNALPMGMDVQMTAPQRPVRRGDEVAFVVLRDGRPLPGLAVELRSDVSALGIWRKTDADGRVVVKLPLAGRWILRGTDVRASVRPDEWDSRFVTLAFDVVK